MKRRGLAKILILLILRLFEPNECTRWMARVPKVLGIKDLQNGAEDRNYRPLGCLPMM